MSHINAPADLNDTPERRNAQRKLASTFPIALIVTRDENKPMTGLRVVWSGKSDGRQARRLAQTSR